MRSRSACACCAGCVTLSCSKRQKACSPSLLSWSRSRCNRVSAPIYVSDGDAPPVSGVDPAVLRDAIHEARKMAIAYIDEETHHTQRTIRPIAMAYYVDVTVLGAWCELRNDFRNFRVDRISNAQLLDERFTAESAKLLAAWLALPKHRPGESLVEPRELVRRAAAI
jgi:predicted DNA-binding transcriptional regulator YafY